MRFTINGDAVYASLSALNAISERDDIATELSIRIAQISRVLRVIAVDIQKQRDRIRQRYALRFGEDHPTHAGKIIPVYLPGTPIEKQTPDNAAAIIPDAMSFSDDAAVKRELLALGEIDHEIDCYALSTAELVKGIPSNIKPAYLEILLWNIDAQELPSDIKPEARRRASSKRVVGRGTR